MSGQGGSSAMSDAKVCRLCPKPARYSLACIVSSVGSSPRYQKCSPGVRLCDDCIRRLCDSEASADLRDALQCAYTTIKELTRAGATTVF
jgi:hypothetical protein